MLGGGFIGQMMDTMKKNRDMLGKTKRVPFDKSGYGPRDGRNHSVVTEPTMSDSDRDALVRKLKRSERRDIALRLALLAALVAIAFVAIIGWWEEFLNW